MALFQPLLLLSTSQLTFDLNGTNEGNTAFETGRWADIHLHQALYLSVMRIAPVTVAPPQLVRPTALYLLIKAGTDLRRKQRVPLRPFRSLLRLLGHTCCDLKVQRVHTLPEILCCRYLQSR